MIEGLVKKGQHTLGPLRRLGRRVRGLFVLCHGVPLAVRSSTRSRLIVRRYFGEMQRE